MAGFIGSHLAERLLSEGHQVLGIDCFLDYYPRSLKERNLESVRTARGFRLIEGDLNLLPLEELVADRQWIFHEAAQPGVRSSWGTGFSTYVRANIEATQRLLEASNNARGLERFVFASSSSVYGNARELPVTEAAQPLPISPYGVTKLTSERLCLVYAEAFQLPALCLRYFTVYGPRQRPDMAFHRFGRALIRGEEIEIYGDGQQTRDFTFVSDVVDANLQVAQSATAPGVFNIGGGSSVSIAQAIGTMESISGRKAKIRYHERARGDVADTAADTSRAAAAFGYAPRVRLADGLRAQLDFLEQLYPTGS